MRQAYSFARPHSLSEEAQRLLPPSVERAQVERFVNWFLYSPDADIEDELRRLTIGSWYPVDALDWIFSTFVLAEHYVPDEDEDLGEDPIEAGRRLIANAWEMYTADFGDGERWIDTYILWDVAHAVDEYYRRTKTVQYGKTRDYICSLLAEYATLGLIDLRTTGEGQGDVGRLFVRLNWPEILRRFFLDRRTFQPDGYVYLLGGNISGVGFYKIGRTVDPAARIKQLGIQLPFPVSVEHIIPCEEHRASEKTLHDLYASKRANGEWFRLSHEDVEEIKAISRMRGAKIEQNAEER
jgi:hypothetical protein